MPTAEAEIEATVAVVEAEQQQREEEGRSGVAQPPCNCDLCGDWRALLYCKADDARLCLACDRHVHAANTVSSKHPRSLLCNSCTSAASTILCCTHRLIFCHNCDFDAHRGVDDHGGGHDRRPVEPFSGCPGAVELASILGVGEEDGKLCGGGGDWCLDGEGGGGDGSVLLDGNWVWETPPVLSLDDLVVPTTAGHGYQAIGVPPLPKNRNLCRGKQKEEILKQIHSMIRSEGDMNNHFWKHEQDIEFHHSLAQQTCQVENRYLDLNHASADAVPGSEFYDESDIVIWHDERSEAADSTSFALNPLLQRSSEDYLLDNDGSADNHSHNNQDNTGDKEHENLVPGEDMQFMQPKVIHELSGPDRGSAISRYREKRKARRYDKHIRYESRKVRAECRMRIKGRFAKIDRDAKS